MKELQIGEEFEKKVDVVIACDLIYLAHEFDNLIHSIIELCTKNHTLVLLGATDHGNLDKFVQRLDEYKD